MNIEEKPFVEAVFNHNQQEISIISDGKCYSLRELICEEVALNGGATMLAASLRVIANIVENMAPRLTD